MPLNSTLTPKEQRKKNIRGASKIARDFMNKRTTNISSAESSALAYTSPVKQVPKKKVRRFPMGMLVRSDTSKLRPKGHHWGASKMAGRGGTRGRRINLSPLPPLVEPKPIRTESSIGKGIRYDENMYEGLLKMYKVNKKRYETDPILRYRRRLWDLQMQKVGLTPEGKKLEGLRGIMMNQII